MKLVKQICEMKNQVDELEQYDRHDTLEIYTVPEIGGKSFAGLVIRVFKARPSRSSRRILVYSIA